MKRILSATTAAASSRSVTMRCQMRLEPVCRKKRVSLNDFAWLFMGAGRKKLQFLATVTEVLQLSYVGLIQFHVNL